MNNTYAEIVKATINIHDKMNIDCDIPSQLKIISKKSPLQTLEKAIDSYSRENMKTRLDISVKYLDFFTLQAYGIYLNFSVNSDTNRIKILINTNRGNRCWERYVAAKELSHVLMGEDEKTHTKDIVVLISDLLSEVDFVKSKIKDIIETEYLSLILALELLVPYCYNHLLIDDSLTSLEIANIFQVPEKIIDFMKKENYQELRIKTYTEVKK